MEGLPHGKTAYPVVSVISDDGKKNLYGAHMQQKGWASRNKWVITGVALLAVAVVAISVSVTTIDHSSSKSKTPVRAPIPAATQAESTVYQLPPPDQWDPTEWEGPVVDYYKALNDSELLTPENIQKFMNEARTFLKEKFNVTLAEHIGSPKTILHYLQISKNWNIIQTILNWAQGRDLTALRFEDLLTLVDELKAAFNEDRIFEFNKAMSVAHEYVASKMNVEGNSSMDMNEMLTNFTAAGFDMTSAEEDVLSDREFAKMKKSKTKKTPPKTAGKKSPGNAPPKTATKTPPNTVAKKSPPAKVAATTPAPTPAPAKTFFKPIVVPVVFHVMQYKDVSSGKTVALPPTYDSPQAAAHLLQEVNKILAKYGTRVQLRLGEVRSNVSKYPYLLVANLQEWQALAAEGIQEKGIPWLEQNNAAVDQYINVYVAGSFNIPAAACLSSTGVDCGRGYAWVAPIVSCDATEKQKWQHVFIMHDEFSKAWYNKDWGGYVPGAIVMAHEVSHHLGLMHTHAGLKKFPYGCSQPNDQIDDTSENEDAQNMKWWDEADQVCGDALSGSPVDWATTTNKFDSCPKAPGKDNIFNIMSYSPDTCRSAHDDGLTPKQVLYMQMKIMSCRPRLYACGSGSAADCYK